jgi:hypothetical protein
MTADEARGRGELGDAEIRQIADVLAGVRRSGRVAIDRELLKERLNDLLSAAGITCLDVDTGDEQSVDAAIAEAAFDRTDHHYLRKQYRDLSKLVRRIERKLVLPELQTQLAAHPRYESAHQTRSRNPKDGSSSGTLRMLDRLCNNLKLLEQAAEALSVFEKSQIETGRPRGNLLDTLMRGLGDVYVEVRGFSKHVLKLPKSRRSIFIRFCHEVVGHFFPPETANFNALSSRWRRLSAEVPLPLLRNEGRNES